MDKKLEKAFNEQIKNEFYSSFLYLSMAAYFESISLEGFGHWMRVQAKEEHSHAMKIFDFLIDRGVRVVLQEIPQPDSEFSSPKAAFEETLKHEKKVTASINALYELAKNSNDNAAEVFLHWFITEQVEEEKNATAIVEKLSMAKPDSASLFMFDGVLAQRK